MSSMRYLRLIVIALLTANGALFAFVSVPDLMDSRIVGFRGHYDENRFQVVTLYTGSPAEEAGLRPGDSIVKVGGRDISDWHHEYETSLDRYTVKRYDLSGTVSYEIRLDNQRQTLHITPRVIEVADIPGLYGVRLSLVVLLIVLTVVILASRTREQSAFLIMLTFVFAGFWLVADIPDWSGFLTPVIAHPPGPWVFARKLFEAFALQMTVACILHVVLVFPRRHPLLQRFPWLLAANYSVPLLILVLIMIATDGGMLQRIEAAREPRLWINTLAMIAAVAILSNSYRRLASPGDREQIRWIVVSMVLFLGIHIALWNIPRMILGHPLVPGYEWVLLPGILIPLSMTMSILNHELFGIRGIIRGRIMLLEALLEREKSLVTHRDARLRELDRELGELRGLLEQYRSGEAEEAGGGPAPSLRRLEEKYPEIVEIRRERLLGASPRWERVFERLVVASRGNTPVVIVGESGTGKTDLARALHRLGDRKEKAYREISCAQFEHADPAFALGRLFGIGTGHGLPNAPREGRIGLLEECNGGTLFLDDFDRLPLSVQDMLLYPLENRPFEPGVGAGPAKSVSIKFIFATNRDPDALAAGGQLRGDVLARIGERIDMPPLRERPEDIPLLVDHFLRDVSRELGHQVGIVSPMAMNLLARYPYTSGNARELRMEIRMAAGKAMLEEDTVLRAGYLSDRVRKENTGEGVVLSGVEEAQAKSKAPTETDVVLTVLRKHRFQVKPAEADLGYSHKSKTLSNYLRGMCIEALSIHGWKAAPAAASLAGNGDPAVVEKLARKMERYVSNARNNVRRGTESRLYRNLPAPYHGALARTIEHLRGAD